jgi:hypothetical protein
MSLISETVRPMVLIVSFRPPSLVDLVDADVDRVADDWRAAAAAVAAAVTVTAAVAAEDVAVAKFSVAFAWLCVALA